MNDKSEEKLVLNELKKLYKQVSIMAKYLGVETELKSLEGVSIIDEILQEIEDINFQISYIHEEIRRLK